MDASTCGQPTQMRQLGTPADVESAWRRDVSTRACRICRIAGDESSPYCPVAHGKGRAMRISLQCLLVVVCTFAVPVATAQLTVCNTSSDVIELAVRHADSTAGPVTLAPKKCTRALSSVRHGEAIDLRTDPPATVLDRGLNVPWLTACSAADKFFTLNQLIECPEAVGRAGRTSYAATRTEITWELEVVPLDRETAAADGRSTRSDLRPPPEPPAAHQGPIRAARAVTATPTPPVPPGVSLRPTWFTWVDRDVISATSEKDRFSPTFDYKWPGTPVVCTYRAHELTNIGSQRNHWSVRHAYGHVPEVTLSVKPKSTDVGFGWAEIPSGSKARLEVLMEWYLVFVQQDMPLPSDVPEMPLPFDVPDSATLREQARARAIREVNAWLANPHVLTHPAYAGVFARFQNQLWPAGLRCGDAPREFVRDRNPPPSNVQIVLPPPAQSVTSALMITCVQSDNGQPGGTEVLVHTSSATCEQARAEALKDTTKNQCGARHRSLRNGPIRWLQTPSCAIP
jgi:hypothetical protein